MLEKYLQRDSEVLFLMDCSLIYTLPVQSWLILISSDCTDFNIILCFYHQKQVLSLKHSMQKGEQNNPSSFSSNGKYKLS